MFGSCCHMNKVSQINHINLQEFNFKTIPENVKFSAEKKQLSIVVLTGILFPGYATKYANLFCKQDRLNNVKGIV